MSRLRKPRIETLRRWRNAFLSTLLCLSQVVVVVYLTDDTGARTEQVEKHQTSAESWGFVSEMIRDFRLGNPKIREVQEANVLGISLPRIEFDQTADAVVDDADRVHEIIEDFQIGFTDAEARQLATVVTQESRRYGFDPRLLLAVILTESSLRKGEVSYQGAHGLMQLKPATAYELAERRGISWQGETSLFDPAFNVQLGSLYLFELIIKYGDVKKALIAYSLGESELRNRLLTNQKLPSQYLNRVITRYKELVDKYPDV